MSNTTEDRWWSDRPLAYDSHSDNHPEWHVLDVKSADTFRGYVVCVNCGAESLIMEGPDGKVKSWYHRCPDDATRA